MKKIVTVVGARPQFIKLAPLAKALEARSDIEHCIVHTGQHYDTNMSQVFFDTMQIPEPRYHLEVGSAQRDEQLDMMMKKLESVFVKEQPDAVIVFGDTNSTLAAAKSAHKLNIHLVHIEAGLRSFNADMPEEINRVVTDQLAQDLSCPTVQARENLQKEEITEGVFVDGDIMQDVLKHFLPQAKQSTIIQELGQSLNSYGVVTLHRNFNTDNKDRLETILQSLFQSPFPLIFPLHPRTKKSIHEFSLEQYLEAPHLIAIEPVEYIDMLALMQNAQCIITDSGGLQKEAYMLKKVCCTLRESTEWIETLQNNWNQLAFSDIEDNSRTILDTFLQHLPSPGAWNSYYGDGTATEKILRRL